MYSYPHVRTTPLALCLNSPLSRRTLRLCFAAPLMVLYVVPQKRKRYKQLWSRHRAQSARVVNPSGASLDSPFVRVVRTATMNHLRGQLNSWHRI
jgi:hypothetical protein